MFETYMDCLYVGMFLFPLEGVIFNDNPIQMNSLHTKRIKGDGKVVCSPGIHKLVLLFLQMKVHKNKSNLLRQSNKIHKQAFVYVKP